jgi:hypothetical protein
MPNLQYLHAVFENSIENLIRIANKRHDAHAGSLYHWRCGLGISSYMCDHLQNSQFDSVCHLIAECTAIGSDFAKVG